MSLLDKTFGGSGRTTSSGGGRARTTNPGSPIAAFEPKNDLKPGTGTKGDAVSPGEQPGQHDHGSGSPYRGHHDRMRETPDKITAVDIDGNSFAVGEWMAAIMNAGGFSEGGPKSLAEAVSAIKIAANVGRWGGPQSEIPAAANLPPRKALYTDAETDIMGQAVAQINKFLSTKVQPAINAHLKNANPGDPFVKAMSRAATNFAALLYRAVQQVRNLSEKESERYFSNIFDYIQASNRWFLVPGSSDQDRARFAKLLNALTPEYVGPGGKLNPPHYNSQTLDSKIGKVLMDSPELSSVVGIRK